MITNMTLFVICSRSLRGHVQESVSSFSLPLSPDKYITSMRWIDETKDKIEPIVGLFVPYALGILDAFLKQLK